MPQNVSFAAAVAQLAAFDDWRVNRFASPHVLPPTVSPVFEQAGFHSYTVMIEVVPPLLKSLTTSRSPSLCTPLKLPLLVPTRPIWFWKNQNPCCASPLLSRRSEPKYSTCPSDVEYRAAKLCRRLSLSGRPPAPSFHPQLLMSCGSLDPPPVKM